MKKMDVDETKEWTEELNKGLEYRRQFGLEESWHFLEQLTSGTHPSQRNAGPNILQSTLDALCAALNVPYPYITVKARRQDYLMKARIRESIDNMLIDRMCIQPEIRRAIYCAFHWGGRGILKIGYDSEYGWDDTLDVGMVQGQQMGMTNSMYDKDFHRIEYNDYEPGMPWVKCVLPHDFIVPWGTLEINDAAWAAHRVVRHIDAVRADTKYDRSVAKKIEPYMSMEDFIKSYQSTIKPYRIGSVENLMGSDNRAADYVELWEIRDRASKRIFVYCPTSEKWLRNEPDSLQLAGIPYVSMCFQPRARSFWTTSDAYYLRYHQAELSDIAIQTTKQRRIAVMKFGVDAGMIDDEELNKATSANVGICFKVRGDVQKAIQPFNPNNGNLTLYNDAEAVRRNAREFVGFSRNQVGEFEQTGRRTAYEAAQVAQAAGLRLDQRQNELRYAYLNIFKHVNAIIDANWKLPRVVQIVGEDGAPLFVKVNGEAMRGEYNYNAGFSTGGNETLQERRQIASTLFMQLIQTGLFDPAALARYLASAWNDPEFTATLAPGVANGQSQGIQMGGGQAGGAPSPGGGQVATTP